MAVIDMPLRGLRAITRVRTLLASCEANFDELTTRLVTQALSYLPDGATAPDYAGILTTHIAILKAVIEKIFAAEKSFRESMSTKNVLGRDVRRMGSQLEKLMRQFRTSVKQHYEEAVLVTFGLTEVPEGNYMQMLAKVRHFLERVATLDLSQILPLDGMEAVDFVKRIQAIQDLYDDTDGKRKQYELAVKDNEIKKAGLNEMIEESRNVTVNVAKNQESLYLLAGMEEQARRLRYLARKPRGVKPVPEKKKDTQPTEAAAPAPVEELSGPATHSID